MPDGLQPPALPTLDLGALTGTYNTSGFTRIAASAIVTGDTTDKILGLQVRIDTGDGTLGVLNGGNLQTTGTVGNIKYDYIPGTKLLRLTDISTGSLANGADFQAVLRDVAISGATSNVSISANLGKPVYRSANGHYYEFVSVAPTADGSLPTWTASNTSAQASTFLGLQGYLASVTSAQENAFLTATFDSTGWIGAQANADPAAPNDPTKRIWTWVGAASPENGKSFWIGGTSAGPGSLVPGTYANWDPTPAPGEPNDYLGNESNAQFTTGGFWNDLANTPTPSDQARYNPNGYWIEYGDASGTDNLAATRATIALTPGSPGPSAPDLVFYDPAAGKVSFAFVGANNTIANEGLTGDTPLLTINPMTPYAGSTNWGLVSAKLDVDNDGLKDTIFMNKTDGSVSVIFGAVLTGTTNRASAARGFALVTGGGSDVLRPLPSNGWEIDFASSKIGAGGTPGLFWRNSITGTTAIWTLSAPTGGNTVTASILVTANVTGNSGWKALGDGEFNQDIATREILWLNSKTNEVVTWSMGSDRTTFSFKYAVPQGTVPTGWNVSAIGNISGVSNGNDNIIWQNGTTVLSWDMKDGALSTTSFGGLGFGVITITAADRVKGLFDTDGDGILDLVAQNDGNGTIASYALTAGFTLKNISAPRTQYASNNVAGYRPAKGGLNGSQLGLVNVAQYGV
jgi:hypothetical protein